MEVTTRLTWNEEKILQKLLGNVSLSLLYKSSVHGCSIENMLDKCSHQGSTITVIYLPTRIIGALILGNYPKMDDENCKDQNSSFYFSLKNNNTETTAFVNAVPRIVSRKLQFYSSNDTGFSLIPHESQVFLEPSLKIKLGMQYLTSSNALEWEIFRVEGMLDTLVFVFGRL